MCPNDVLVMASGSAVGSYRASVLVILFTAELLVVVVVSWDVFCRGHTHGYMLITLTDEHLTGII